MEEQDTLDNNLQRMLLRMHAAAAAEFVDLRREGHVHPLADAHAHKFLFIKQKTSIDSSYSQIIRVQRNHTPIYHTMDLFMPIQDLN